MELCGVTDRFLDGAPHYKWCGRKNGPRYVQAPSLPPRTAADLGEVDITMHGMIWARNRLLQLKWLAEISGRNQAGSTTQQHICVWGRTSMEYGMVHENRGEFKPVRKAEEIWGDGLSASQRRQWWTLTRKIASKGSLVQELAIKEVKWKVVIGELERYRRFPWQAATFLKTTCEWVEATIKDMNTKHVMGKAEGWKKWLSKQLKEGAGGAHRWVKRDLTDPEKWITVDGKRTAAPRDIVEIDFEAWSKIWSRLKDRGGTPWRTMGAVPANAPSLPAITAVELRRASRTFKERTGTGVDKLGPRHYAWLSDELLTAIGKLLMEMGRWGFGPSRWTRR
jgi:hypothetical protein